MVEWLYLESGVSRGPVSSIDLRALAGQGVVMPWTPVRRINEHTASPWRRAGEVTGLFSGDISAQLGGPICGQCGKLLGADGHCQACEAAARPVEPPPIPTPDPSATIASTEPSRLPGEGGTRYPHLLRYLGILEIVAKATLALSLGIALIILALGGGYSGPSLELLLGCILIALLSYLGYLASMASVQVVRVLLDIESNTREIASRSGS